MKPKTLIPVVLAAITMTVRAAAQVQAVRDQTPLTLERATVTLTGTTALGVLASRIKTSTHVIVHPAAYLADRVVTVECANEPLGRLLDDLCEMYDWRWSIGTDAVVRIERKAVPVLTESTALCLAFRSLLPIYFRALLRPPVLVTAFAEPDPDKSRSAAYRAEMENRRRVVDISTALSDSLIDPMSFMGPGMVVPTKRLSAGQMRDLQELICMHFLQDGTIAMLCACEIPGFERDWTKDCIFLDGGGILLGRTFVGPTGPYDISGIGLDGPMKAPTPGLKLPGGLQPFQLNPKQYAD